MTMPPAAERPEDSRRYFAALAQLAAERGLAELSMGTTQDFRVAVGGGGDRRAPGIDLVPVIAGLSAPTE